MINTNPQHFKIFSTELEQPSHSHQLHSLLQVIKTLLLAFQRASNTSLEPHTSGTACSFASSSQYERIEVQFYYLLSHSSK
jgi:hypothetical protein